MVEGAKDLIAPVKEMCRRRDLNFQKFVSNEREVLRSIPSQDRAEDLKNINLDLEKFPLERTLGDQGCIQYPFRHVSVSYSVRGPSLYQKRNPFHH